jgi:hypothetical protein
VTLSAPLVIGFDYTRSLGPVLGRFMAGLRDRRVLGGRTADGRVHVPPLEYDPDTLEPVTDLVEVSPAGTVVSWTWTDRPVEGQPLDRPFGWALIRLDGADTPLLHAHRHAGAHQVGGLAGRPHPRHRLLRALPAARELRRHLR